MDLQKVLDKIEIIKQQKEEAVKNLLQTMLETNSVDIRNNIGFALVDNFKDKCIELAIIKLIEDSRWAGSIGTLIYLLGEVSSDEKYLMLLIKLILSNEIGGEIYMGCINMIIRLELPLNESNVNEALNALEMSSVSSCIEILGLKFFLEQQLQTSKIIQEL
jgi:hypothetical protein